MVNYPILTTAIDTNILLESIISSYKRMVEASEQLLCHFNKEKLTTKERWWHTPLSHTPIENRRE